VSDSERVPVSADDRDALIEGYRHHLFDRFTQGKLTDESFSLLVSGMWIAAEPIFTDDPVLAAANQLDRLRRAVEASP
jgi:hypothetical protein